MATRTLNGLGNIGGGFSLIKMYNLGDLTDISSARVNLGLVGSLTTTDPYINLSPFNGTTNQIITLNSSSTALPNKLVTYDVSGNLNSNNITTNTLTLNGTSNNILGNILLNGSLTSSNQVFFTKLNVSTSGGFFTINNNSNSTRIMYFYDNGNINTNGHSLSFSNTTPNYNLDFSGATGCIGTFTTGSIKTTSSTSVVYCNQFNTFQNILSQSDFTYTIGFNNNHLNNIGNISCSAITSSGPMSLGTNTITCGAISSSNDLACSNVSCNTISTTGLISVNGTTIINGTRNIKNIPNLSKLIWSQINTTSTTSSINNTCPTGTNPATNFTTSTTLYTYRGSFPFVFNGETSARFNYNLSFPTGSTNTILYLMICSVGGGNYIAPVASSTYNTTGSVIIDSITLSLSGLTIGALYSVVWCDKSGTSTTYGMYGAEISLLY